MRRRREYFPPSARGDHLMLTRRCDRIKFSASWNGYLPYKCTVPAAGAQGADSLGHTGVDAIWCDFAAGNSTFTVTPTVTWKSN